MSALPNPFPKTGTTAYLRGDALANLSALPSGVFQTCVTSPPYFGLRSYLPEGHNDKILEIGSESELDEYIESLVRVFREVRRTLRDDGILWMNLGDSYATDGKWGGSSGGKHVESLRGNTGIGRSRTHTGLKPKDLVGVPWRAAFALQADGWYLRSAIVWHKPNAMPESTKDRPSSCYEMLFMFSKSQRYFYDHEAIKEDSSGRSSGNKKRVPRSEKDGPVSHTGGVAGSVPWVGESKRNARNVWSITSKSYSEAHFATFPPELPERCIQAATSEAGQCPTCGSPWERIVEKGEPDYEHQAACGADLTGGYNGTSTKDYKAAGAQDASATKARILAGMVQKKTIGWKPTCNCPAHVPVPQLVLDCFGGSGTTAMVASALGRDTCLIDLHPDYPALAEKRIGTPVLDFFVWG